MLFSSFEFVLFFIAVLVLYFGIGARTAPWVQKLLLIGSSLFFYQWWKREYLLLLVGSLVFNYLVARWLYTMGQKHGEEARGRRRLVLLLGLAGNILCLGYFKYKSFVLSNLNRFLGTQYPVVAVALPLAISFFTFQQIAFLVDAYHLDPVNYGFLQYALFIAFFPQLIMGPICHHKELVPQFQDPERRRINMANVAAGLFLFAMGVAKKSLLADPLTAFAATVYLPPDLRTFTGTLPVVLQHAAPGMIWMATLAYTFSYYFDLSGYADMAMGLGKMLNIDVPANFNSPFLARNMADFWRRWHMTLSRFLGTYVNKPMHGGWIPSPRRLYISILITFFVSGLWHGAGWTFMVWGLLNGVCVMGANAFQINGIRLNHYVARVLTLTAVMLLRALFVARSLDDWVAALRGMVGLSGQPLSAGWSAVPWNCYALVALGAIITLLFKNSTRRFESFTPSITASVVTAFMLLAAMATFTQTKPFLYFVF